MFCKSCGTKLEEGVKFCNSCGARVEAPQPEVAQSPEARPVEQKVQPAPQTIQQNYTQPAQPAAAPMPVPAYDPPLTIGQFLGMFLLLLIPIANIILIFVWAFGSGKNRNKKNFAIAYLIMAAIGIVLSILLSSAITAMVAGILNNYY